MSPLERASMWISYSHQPAELDHLCNLHSHHRLMSPRADWERTKIGGGTPPVLTRHGWLVLFHGVSPDPEVAGQVRYAAGVLILDAKRPERIRYRSPHPILTPELDVPSRFQSKFVFPTAVDCRHDLGQPDRIDVYYGIADRSIGVAALTVPASLLTSDEDTEALRDDPLVRLQMLASRPGPARTLPSGVVKDPVCGMEIETAKAERKREFAGSIYYLCSSGCQEAFDADPASYVGNGQ